MSKTVNAQRITFVVNNEEYRMDRYSSTKILIYKKVNGVFDFVSAKEVIRQKLAELDAEKYSLEETAKSKYNTRALGTKLYELIK